MTRKSSETGTNNLIMTEEKFTLLETLNNIRKIHPNERTIFANKLEEIITKILTKEKDEDNTNRR